jgi:hypothetical protein
MSRYWSGALGLSPNGNRWAKFPTSQPPRGPRRVEIAVPLLRCLLARLMSFSVTIQEFSCAVAHAICCCGRTTPALQT